MLPNLACALSGMCSWLAGSDVPVYVNGSYNNYVPVTLDSWKPLSFDRTLYLLRISYDLRTLISAYLDTKTPLDPSCLLAGNSLAAEYLPKPELL